MQALEKPILRRRLLPLGAALLALLLLLPISVRRLHAQDILTMQLQQGFGKNKVRYKNFDWHIVESEHLQLLYEPEFEALAERAVDYLEEAYDHISETLHHELSHKPPIVIYQSHYEFEQTNIIHEFLPPGVAGFAEPLRYRMVIPFNGDLDEFESVLTHELTHIFQYDILYKGPIKRLSNPLSAPPTWIMEGLAEYTTSGRNTIDEMVLRDAILTDELIPLEVMNMAWGYGNVFLAYKQSHSLMEYIAANYGPEKVSRILRLWDSQNDTDKLLKRLIDLDMKSLDERWSAHMRKQYWPLLQTRDYLSEIGRKIVDDDETYSTYLAPQWSLSGDMLVALSSDGVEQHVDIIRLRDGSLVERLTHGMRVAEYDYLTFGDGTVDWAPDGTRIAFVAKDGPKDQILLWDLYDKKLQQSLSFDHIELIEALDWSPDSRRLAFIGTGYGQSDLYLLDVDSGQLQQLTGTPQRDDHPAWSPDGTRIAFSSKHKNQFDIKIYDLESGEVHTAVASPTDDLWPQWLPAGNKLLFVSTREKINDLFVYHLEEQREYRLTRTLSGVMAPTLSPDGRQIVLSTYYHGRSQLYLMDMPELPEIRRRDAELLARAGEEPAPQLEPLLADETSSSIDSLLTGADAIPLHPSPATRTDTQNSPNLPPVPLTSRSSPSPDAVLLADVSGSLPLLGDAGKEVAPPVAVDEPVASEPDEGESILSQRPYTPKLEFDGVSVQMGYFDGFFSSIAQLSMSDLLGNHALSLATDYIASQEINNDFNFALAYSYYGQRPTYNVSIFNWNQFYNTSQAIGIDQYGRPLSGILRSQQRGMMANASYPLDLYRRIDMSYTYVSENQAQVWPVEEEHGSISAHLFKTAYVHDSVTYGLLGPTAGRGYFLSVGRTLDFSKSHRSFSHLELDYRHYLRLGRWSVLGLRASGVGSIGRNALAYNLGGPTWFLPFYTGLNLNMGPLRGYGFSEFTGSRIALFNAELRVPFIRQIVFGWPGTFAIPAVDGSLFFDVGTAWNEEDDLDLWPFHNPYELLEPEGQKQLRASVGFGLLVYFILPMNFEFAKQTDLQGNYSDYKFHFSFGQSF